MLFNVKCWAGTINQSVITKLKLVLWKMKHKKRPTLDRIKLNLMLTTEGDFHKIVGKI